MSQAQKVPETYQLTGDDVVSTIQRVRWQHLLKDSLKRLRVADGFSHARASAFALALLLVEALIAVLGLAVAMGSSGFSKTVTDVLQTAVPGPAGQLLTSAARQAQEAGSANQYTALLIGLAASLITGTTALGQFERSCNRIYGVEDDRPSARKYGRAALLAVSVGVIASIGVTMLVLGRPIAVAFDGSWAGDVWVVARWPLAVALLILSTTAMLRWSPNRRQPGYTWLIYGAAVSVLLTVGASIVLALFFRWSPTFGDTYGPLAGMIGLLLWCYAIAVAGLFGIAITAQLEQERVAGSSAGESSGA
ncbi:MAG: YihY/virulence factor BrkB family protein [Actinomycetia bacterium]|nr:YihY/virulence factor BrkB family protein [Actinomycetes bacterium]